ncbi:GFO/IDH/MOCA family oxidoreductase [Nostocoides japonicum T1-X7]|uniref:GFO/IDH/MOCA family oxidoreductase n=1 Tax=Nostocoides japonicum T1-X7 TaxID=1194083 RepID=A0A077LTP4_9MICO|nr:GFO/IDH/MOCA family oxidoreductase [Tetrasphaera japonica T1-X7]
MTTTLTLPEPRTPDPMDAPPLRWGILAPGGIARTMAAALRAATRQEIVAVGSRDLGRARAFADEFGIGTAYGSYAELVADPSVDVVYVASPHSEHRDQTLLALDAGKHVLVEKAFARNRTEALEMVERARSRGLFLMEALWTRFLPHVDVIRRSLEEGLLGDLVTVFADHGQPLHPGGPRRLADPVLAGGALLDLGVYPLHFADLVLGGLESVSTVGALTAEGVDAQEAMTVVGPSGALGVLHATMLAKTPTTASVVGSLARIDVDGDRFYGPSDLTLATRGGVLDTWQPPSRDHGLHFEAAEVARCITAGRTESPLLPLDTTLRVMAAMDAVRRDLGVVYPGERP